MSRIYAVANQKGGVGKTTTVVNLGACIAAAGHKVLVVDLDPQSNATTSLGIDRTCLGRSRGKPDATIYDVLIAGVPMAEAIAGTPIENLSIVPSELDLAGAEVELLPRIARESVLRNSLGAVCDPSVTADVPDFEFIFIDAPPSLGLLTINALVAADSVLVPIQCEYFALEGVSQLMRTVEMVRRQVNPSLTVGPVVLTMYDNRLKLNQQVVADVRKYFGDRVARRTIPRNSRLAEAPSHGLPITLYDPRSRGAQAYAELAQEVIRHGETGPG